MRTALLFVLVACCSATARATDDRTKLTPEELFKKADKDSDGKLTLTEYQAGIEASPKHAPQHFKKADKDGDGKLTLDELKPALEAVAWWKLSRKTPEEQFKATDKDSDGKLSLEEFKELDPHKNHYEAHFKKYDKDGDGKLSLGECKAFIESVVKDKE